jgi:hypothetical protein
VFLYSCSSDNKPISSTQSLNFSEIFNIQVDTLELDMITDTGENALYITYSADNGLNENLMKYNLTTSSQTTITHPDVSTSRQIEIIGNVLYSVSFTSVYKFDLNLGNATLIRSDHTANEELKGVSYNDEILFPMGYNNITSFNTLANTTQTLLNSWSTTRARSDGEIYNDKLYSFGGSTGMRISVSESFNEINIFDIVNNTWSQQSLPFTVFESFTALNVDKIIVAGNKNSAGNEAFIGIYDPSLNTFTEIPVSLDLNNISIRSIAILNNDLYVAYADFLPIMPSLIPIKVAKATLQ